MKNVVLFLIALFSAGHLFAQEDDILRSKNGHAILPQTGDIALGFDAVPLANLALNALKIMGNTGQEAEHPGYASGMNQVIVGKYFLNDRTAVRARFGVNMLTNTEKVFGDNPLTPSNPDPDDILLAKFSDTESAHFLGLGLEFRRGYHRLHGIYGAELLVGTRSEKSNNTYEIAFNEMAQDSGFIGVGSSRVLSSKNSGAFIVGARGFIGVEYFVAPKISIGAEFGWSLGITTGTRTYSEVEFWDVPTGETGDPRSFTREFEGSSSERDLGLLVDTGISSLLGSSAAVTVHFLF